MNIQTVRDLMILAQGALASMAGFAAWAGAPNILTVLIAVLALTFALTPSRLPPRNERGQFSKRD